jgi:hypothetical protein
MKKIIYIFVLSAIILLSGCTMSKQYLKRGQYDLATMEAGRKLLKNPNKKKHILVLEEAYPKAIKQHEDRIVFLHKDGQPDRWDEIFHTYSDMEMLQISVENVIPLHLDGRQISFVHVDYDERIIEAKRKAADYYYAHAVQLMGKNNKFEYRRAYDELNIVKSYTKNYSDVDNLLEECYNKGLSHIMIIVVNSTPFSFQDDFMINLIDFPMADLNSFWVKNYTRDSRNGDYDVYANVTLTIADVSRNNESSSERTETKDIKDGWEYKLDDNGNIMTDTAGNQIKIVKYKTIRCRVISTRQFKQAHIEGSINYVDTETHQIVRTVPVAADHTFENFYTSAEGDLDALSNETRANLKNRPVRYPNDIDMIYAANETLRNVIFQAFMDGRYFINQRY